MENVSWQCLCRYRPVNFEKIGQDEIAGPENSNQSGNKVSICAITLSGFQMSISEQNIPR